MVAPLTTADHRPCLQRCRRRRRTARLCPLAKPDRQCMPFGCIALLQALAAGWPRCLLHCGHLFVVLLSYSHPAHPPPCCPPCTRTPMLQLLPAFLAPLCSRAPLPVPSPRAPGPLPVLSRPAPGRDTFGSVAQLGRLHSLLRRPPAACLWWGGLDDDKACWLNGPACWGSSLPVCC